MLTPQDITGKVFEKAVFGGYDAKSVDRFMKELAVEFEALRTERDEFKVKLKLLAEKVEEYRECESAVQQALISAQKSAQTMLAEAEEQRERRLAEIHEESERLLFEEREKSERLLGEERAKNEKCIAEETAATEAKLAELRRKRETEEKAYAEAAKRSADYLAELRRAGKTFAEQLLHIYDFVDLPEAAEPAALPAEQAPAAPETQEDASGLQVQETKDEVMDRTVSAVSGIVRKSYSSSEAKNKNDKAEGQHLPKIDYDNLQFGENYRKKK